MTSENGDPQPPEGRGPEAGDPGAEGVAARLEPAVPAAARRQVALLVAQAAEQTPQEVSLSLSVQ